MATCLANCLCGQLAALAAGAGGAVVIAGAAGRNLAEQVKSLACAAGAGHVSVLTGRCRSAGETPPFGPWRELLGPAAAELLLGDRAPAAKAASLMAWLTGQGQPALLILEELQGADPASLELAVQVARLAPAHGVLLLLAYCPDDLHRAHPLWQTLSDLARAGAPTIALATTPTDEIEAPSPAWHLERAEALLRAPEPDPWAPAYHLRQAHDPRAPAWLGRACESALAFGAFRQAAQACEWALEALPPGAPEQLPFLIRLGLCHCRLGNFRQALDCLEEALAVARSHRSFAHSPAP